MKASVIIPTYNRRDQLKMVLDGLTQQTCDMTDVEVIVISDGSQDGTEEMLRQRAENGSLQLRPIFQQNQGTATSRNHGLQEAQGDLIIFLDDDVVPRPVTLQAHFEAHDRYGPNVVVLGPLLTPKDYPMSPWVAWEQLMLEKQYLDMAKDNWQPTARQFYTGNVSLSRQALLDAGGFDATLRRGEDVELGYRLANRGLSFIFEPDAAGKHYVKRSYESWLGISYAYGVLDVDLTHNRNQKWLLPRLLHEYHERHPLVRALVRLCLDKKRFSEQMVAFLHLMGRAGHALNSRQLPRFAYSGIFNLRYYQGIADELGGRKAFFSGVAENVRETGTVPGVYQNPTPTTEGGQNASEAF